MQRRHFVTSMLAASASAAALEGAQRHANEAHREYYELRRYQLESGQGKTIDNYLSEALIPALNRLGTKPVGVFNLTIGEHLPAVYVLIPHSSIEAFASVERHLANDQEYLKAGEPFLNATSTQPPFVRMESELMAAFEGTQLTVPPSTASGGKRVFQLRRYESPSHHAHERKIQMFHSGEFEIFKKAGFWPVFYGDVRIGSRLPHLTYMLSYPDVSQMNAYWKAFEEDPQWKKLTSDPRFNYDHIVTNITSIILSPAKYSQI